MKDELKIAIANDNGMENSDKTSILEYKPIGLITGFLLLLALVLTVFFTLQSFNGLTDLRNEVQALKIKVKVLQDTLEKTNKSVFAKISENCCEATDVLKKDNDYKSDYEDYNTEDDYYYDNDEYDISDTDNTNTPTTSYIVLAENFTKDSKDSKQRMKRSLSENGEREATVNSQVYSKQKSSSQKNAHNFKGVITQSPGTHEKRTQTSTTLNGSKNLPRFHSNDKPKTFRRSLELKSRDSFNTVEELGVEFSVVGNVKLPSKQHERSIEIDETMVHTGRIKPLPAAHYSGDTSDLRIDQHEHFLGNGRMRHPKQKFVNWIERNWVSTLGMDQHYTLDDGALTIKEAGLYFIYAQIYYLDDHDINGFTIYKNNNEAVPILQCTTTTHSVATVTKGNSCFTAGVEYLEENSRISLVDSTDQRFSVFTPEKSFFGVIKLGDVKIK